MSEVDGKTVKGSLKTAVGLVAFVVIMAGLVGIAVQYSGFNSASSTSQSSSVDAERASKLAAAKKVADVISVQSTGSSFYAGQYHYGFLLTNDGKQPFTGTVTIMLTNDGKWYSDAELELTEHDPAGTIPAPGLVKGYSYKVTVNGVTTELYPVHDILVN